MYKKWVLLTLTICSALGLFPPVGSTWAGQTVLVSTFPIYQIVRNVTREREGMRVDLMLPSQMGCTHNYTLTPQDMHKLAKADLLVINGHGMEEFLGAPVKKANPEIRVLDSSTGIQEVLQYPGDQVHGHTEPGRHDEGHEHHGVNPHLFVSPRMTARIALNIAAELSKIDPDGAAIYFKNAQLYAETINKLAEDMAALGRRLKNKRIVQPHGIFDYLARDMGLEIVGVVRTHGQEPSVAEMMQLIKIMKEKGAGAIFTEPQYPEKTGATLAQEAGIPVALLDPAAIGPEDAPLTHYEMVMRRNMKIFESVLGTK